MYEDKNEHDDDEEKNENAEKIKKIKENGSQATITVNQDSGAG